MPAYSLSSTLQYSLTQFMPAMELSEESNLTVQPLKGDPEGIHLSSGRYPPNPLATDIVKASSYVPQPLPHFLFSQPLIIMTDFNLISPALLTIAPTT